jgi:hypothetical protein
LVGAPTAAKNQEYDKTANTGCEANDESEMTVYPALDFTTDRAVLALTL